MALVRGTLNSINSLALEKCIEISLFFESDAMRSMQLVIAILFLNISEFAAAQAFQFESFHVNSVSNRTATNIDWSSVSDSRRFRSRLSRAFDQGIKFAGHYAVAEFGCGTNCKTIAIIDMQNGRVVFGPTAEFDFEFRINSRLLVANSYSVIRDFIEDGYCNDVAAPPLSSRYYEWTGSEFKQIGEINACPSRVLPKPPKH